MKKEVVAERFKAIQDKICAALEACDGQAKFQEDPWQHHQGGGGRTRVIQDGAVFEKGGVNFSAVSGALPPVMQKHFGVRDADFFATGVSIVIHPHSPLVPIIHMNIRYFEMFGTDLPTEKTKWFGGGIDLTPIYVDSEEAKGFHTSLKEVCDAHDSEYYAAFKKWADEYFYIPHRGETRGVGGVFFDHLGPSENHSIEERFDFACAVGESFARIYPQIVDAKKSLSFTPEQKQWQHVRRGRYVEFNLVYDRGTKFGLETKGRIESILMSLPKTAGWEYNLIPTKDSEEAKTLAHLKQGLDWISMA